MAKFCEVSINGIKIRAELASNPLTQSLGLMFRKGLSDGNGMLFDFKLELFPKIWMAGMRFPIDIIWADKEKKIVHIAHEVQPASLFDWQVKTPSRPARYVLEVPAGFTRKNKITVWDEIKLKLII